jgi:hypothetical protein
MFKLYLKGLALAFLVTASLGWIAPYFVSAPSNIAVACGLLYLLVVFPYATLQLVLSIKKDLSK